MQQPSRWAAPLGAGLATVGVIVLLSAISIWTGRSPGWAYDFHAYFDAALRLIATGTPYQAETLSGPFRPGPFGLYLYTPVPALVFVPLRSEEHTSELQSRLHLVCRLLLE